MSILFRDALKFWTKLEFIRFGGPAGQISIMQLRMDEYAHFSDCGFFAA